MIDLINKYKGLEYICGTNDCNLMMLEHTDFDITKIKPFSDIKSGFKSISTAIGYQTLHKYLVNNGYKQINPLEAEDGCVIISRIHCFLWFDGKLFGVSPRNIFEFMDVSIKQQQQLKVYKRVN